MTIVWGPPGSRCGAIGTHRFAARAGHHLAPALLSSGRNVYEHLGRDFTLLALGVEPDDVSRFATSAARLRVPLTNSSRMTRTMRAPLSVATTGFITSP